MLILDDLDQIKKLDRLGILASAASLPEQIGQTWEEVSKLKLPLDAYRKVKNVVVAGMGGSALGARIIDSLNFEVLDLPLEIINGYRLPAYADQDSLAIVSSYSGNTEETLSCLREALRKKCRLFVIASGGKLAQIARQKNLPAYIFDPQYNPSNQPRMGLGYSIIAQMALLARCGFIRLEASLIGQVISHLERMKKTLLPAVPYSKNQAKQVALSLKGKALVFISAEHLIGAAHAFKNMINENSKVFAVRFSLPEVNHHLLDALAYPSANQKWLQFVFLQSELYHPEITKRLVITKRIVEKNKVDLLLLKLKGKTKLIQAFETIYLGSFVSGYLAFLSGLDPAPIFWVDYLKEAMKKNG